MPINEKQITKEMIAKAMQCEQKRCNVSRLKN